MTGNVLSEVFDDYMTSKFNMDEKIFLRTKLDTVNYFLAWEINIFVIVFFIKALKLILLSKKYIVKDEG